MKRLVLLALGFILFTGVPAYAQGQNVVIATGGIGGVYFYYGTQVAEILNKTGVASATAMQTAASVDNMLLIRDKTNESRHTFFFATVLPDSAYVTVKGTHEKFAKKPAKADILWMMYPNYLHIVTTEQTGITKLADLQESGSRPAHRARGPNLLP